MTEIYVESDVKEFIKRLPELSIQPPSVHLLMLVVRSKKARELLNVKLRDLVVERDIVRPTPIWRGRYFSKLHNLAILQHHGFYDMKSETKSVDRIPAEAMGILATVSPRNVYLATAELMKENITYLYTRSEDSDTEIAKVNSRFFGFLHSHRAKGTYYATLDIDTRDEAVFRSVRDEVSPLSVFMVTETSGGWHIVVKIGDGDEGKLFYGNNGVIQRVTNKHGKLVEVQRDSQEPVPGTLYCRAGGEHHFVKLLE